MLHLSFFSFALEHFSIKPVLLVFLSRSIFWDKFHDSCSMFPWRCYTSLVHLLLSSSTSSSSHFQNTFWGFLCQPFCSSVCLFYKLHLCFHDFHPDLFLIPHGHFFLADTCIICHHTSPIPLLIPNTTSLAHRLLCMWCFSSLCFIMFSIIEFRNLSPQAASPQLIIFPVHLLTLEVSY